MPSTRCPACAGEIDARNRFCAQCGADLAVSAIVTAPADSGALLVDGRRPDDGARPDSGPREGRFPIGIVLGERFRILGLLGHGGMGEVYRAHDLKLEQQVALKFLPEAAAYSPSLMERFRGEVRIARQISHRNVCRVYDLGEVNGAAFISMEYVDGEDLASLLRRIGRLPGDKALEFARRLCAGLAAAHEKGVLHRDLKPANIMIDGRGQLLVMDFGLAAVADAISGRDIRSGTPAYMSPEQKEGREVTVRSDIYALGLVLAEMFSGSRPAADGRLSAATKDVDPVVERVIQRCADPNPERRFASALDVARALPGGDPLAEALAAGETPSPAMVAASDDTGALSVRAALACFAFSVAALVAVVLLRDQRLLSVIPTPDSPDVLAHNARTLAARFGYPDAPQDEAVGFSTDNGYQSYALDNWTRQEFRSRLSTGQPRLLGFWYRRSPGYLVSSAGKVGPEDPPPIIPGMVRVETDLQGRLHSFAAVPPRVETSETQPVAWDELFVAAGLNQNRFQPADPQWVPPVSFDTRAAWTGTLEGTRAIPIRLEAASWKGRLVFFQVVPPWTRPLQISQAPDFPVVRRLAPMLIVTVFCLAGFLAWRHHQTQRGDRRGAIRLAVFTGSCTLLGQLFVAHHIATPAELGILMDAVSGGAFSALTLGVLYMALEPYVRRRWPQSLIGWTRLLDGRIRDPLVGGQILVGMSLGFTSFLAVSTTILLQAAREPLLASLDALRGPGPALGIVPLNLTIAILLSLFLFFLVFLTRTILRRDWVAVAAVVVLFIALIRPPGVVATIGAGSLAAFAMWVLLRFGLLPVVAAAFVNLSLVRVPITSGLPLWYSGASFVVLGTILVLALWSCNAALGGRQMWKGDFLEV